MRVQPFTFNALQENTYVLIDDTGACAVVDAGCYERGEQQALRAFIDGQGLRVERLLCTHGHLDHVLGNAFVHRTWNVPLGLHADDEPTLRTARTYAAAYGCPAYEELLPGYYLVAGETISFGNTRLEVRLAPGHAPGHVVFYSAADGCCLGGDVLFRQSVGRTDLPGGNPAQLMRSIQEQLYTLPPATVVYPGHGPETTVGHEMRHNPFCRARTD